MKLTTMINKLRRVFHIHKWSHRIIWIEDSPDGRTITTIGDRCEICKATRPAPFGGGKDTGFVLPMRYYKDTKQIGGPNGQTN